MNQKRQVYFLRRFLLEAPDDKHLIYKVIYIYLKYEQVLNIFLYFIR